MKEEKDRFPLRLHNEVRELVKERFREDGSKSQSEFIEKAILFYDGYLHAKQTEDYLPRVLGGILSGTLKSFGDRMGHLMFKQAVECNIINHIISADVDVDAETYERLRNRSIRQVRETNGKISFEDDLTFQQEAY